MHSKPIITVTALAIGAALASVERGGTPRPFRCVGQSRGPGNGGRIRAASGFCHDLEPLTLRKIPRDLRHRGKLIPGTA